MRYFGCLSKYSFAALIAAGAVYFLNSANAISPNPNERFVAHRNVTKDGNDYSRTVTLVEARFATNSDNNPVEETLDGFTILYNKTSKRYEYADLNSGDLKASGIPVVRGQKPPKDRFKKHITRTAEGLAKVAMQPMNSTDSIQVTKSLYGGTGSRAQIKILVVPILFADHNVSSRWRPTKEQLTTLFNANGGDPHIAPSGSVKDVFLTMSHNKLNVTATVVDWIQVSQKESYYAANNRGYTSQYMHQATKEALDYLETIKFPFGQFDANKDGLIDAICFVHSGYGAEFGGISDDGAYFMDRIWSHKWSFSWRSALRNITVGNYALVSSIYGTAPSTNGIARVGVIAHEMARFLGINVHLNDGVDGAGIGNWDLLGNAWGFDGTQNCVPLMSPWTKLQLGWIVPKEITRLDSGKILSLLPSSESNANYFIIKQGFPVGEYLMLEYRRKSKLEYCMPLPGGMAVWHVDDKATTFNDQGWPGQVTSNNISFPHNGKHYRVALLQADGSYELEKDRNSGDAGDLFYSLASLGPGIVSTSDSVQYPNTDTYQGGIVLSTNLTLSGIEERTTGTLGFQVQFANPTPAPIKPPSPMKSPSREPTLSPTMMPTVSLSPTSSPSYSPTRSSAPSATVPNVCTKLGQKLFKMNFSTDTNGVETSWELWDAKRGPVILRTGGPYYRPKYNANYGMCLDDESCYKILIKDTARNGGATYKISYDSQLILESPANASSYSLDTIGADFGNQCVITPGPKNTMAIGKDGNRGVKSVMFDVASTTKDYMITRFAGLHLQSVGGATVTLKVYTKNGSFNGFETNPAAWSLIFNKSGILPMGKGNYTSLDSFAVNIPVMKDTIQGFYLEFDSPVLLVSDLSPRVSPFTLYKSDPPIDVLVGIESRGQFGGRVLNTTLMGVDGRFTVAPLQIVAAVPVAAPTPVASPIGVPVPTPLAPTPFVCPSNQTTLVLDLKTDAMGSETSWKVTDVMNGYGVVASGGNYTNSVKIYNNKYCLDPSSCFKYVISDSKGDGGGGYKVTWNNTVEVDTITYPSGFQFLDGVDFGNGCTTSGSLVETIGKWNDGGSFGQMFDIKGKQDIILKRFTTVHLRTGGKVYDYRVYSKNGSYKGYETKPDAWTLVLQQNLTSAGLNVYTYPDKFNIPCPILANTTQAFYVVVDAPDLMFGDGAIRQGGLKAGDVYARFPALDVLAGVAINSTTPFVSPPITNLTTIFSGRLTYGLAKVNF